MRMELFSYICKSVIQMTKKTMEWSKLISNKRLGQEYRHAERHDDRSEFKRDYDRLIFSAPFRRMQNKTQVFPLPGSVFVHNRLTHSLEVASVGRCFQAERTSSRTCKYAFRGDRNDCKRRVFSSRYGQSSVRTQRRKGYTNVLYRGQRAISQRQIECRFLVGHHAFRGKCQRVSSADTPVQRSARGRVRNDLLHIGRHCEISVCE